MFRRIVAGALVAMMTTGMTGVSADPVKGSEVDTQTAVVQTLSETDEAKLEALYEKAEALEAELMAVYDEIADLDPNYMNWEDYQWTFEDFAMGLSEDLDADTLAAAKALFDEALALEEKEDYEAAEKVWEKLYEMDIFADWDDFEWTFEDFATGLAEDVDADVLAEAETLFNQAIALEKEEKYDEAELVWTKLYELELFGEMDYDYEPWTFAELKEEFKSGLTDEVLAKAEGLFNQAMALEEAEDYTAAEEIWLQLFELDLFDYDEADYQ